MATAENLGFAVAKLAESGLLPEHAKALNLDVFDGEETRASGASAWVCPSLVFNYMDPRNPSKPLSPRPKHPPFRRLRHLGPSIPLDAKNKPIRYSQAPGSGVCAYFPTLVDWPAIIKDTDRAILITEGELKAAKACERGFACIGLGGVSNFVNSGMGVGFLPELEHIDWVRRRVFIVYDNDGLPKEEVMQAINRLAAELVERGALPYSVVLPLLPGAKKTGLDDYLVAFPEQRHLGTLLYGAESITIAQPLWAMNATHVLISNPGLVVERSTGRLIDPMKFATLIKANAQVAEQKVQADGSISMKKVPLAKHWLSWPLRAELNNLTYKPGQPQLIESTREWNQWPGWKATPVKGDIAPFITLIDHLFSNTTKEVKEWFLRWLAFPIQHPGTKLYTAAVLHGSLHGTGKSFVGYAMGEIYGQNFIEVKQDQLFAKFNGWAANKQLVLGDDITGSEKRETADRLKHMITCKTNTIDEKYLVPYTVPDCVNYFLTSNQPDGFYIEDADRRLFIHEVPKQLLAFEFYSQVLEPWVFSEAGRNALMYYLLHYPLGDFHPRGKAIATEAKSEMVELGRSEIGAWCAKLRTNPELVLNVGSVPITRDLFSSEELRNLYDPAHVKKSTANAVARNLKMMGFHLIYGGQPVPIPGRPTARYFAVRNDERWLKAKYSEIKKHLES